MDENLAKFDAHFSDKSCKKTDTQCISERAALSNEVKGMLGTVKYQLRRDKSETWLSSQQVPENKLTLNDALWIARMLEGEAGGELTGFTKTEKTPAYEHGSNHAALLVWSIVQFQYTNHNTKYSVGSYMQSYSTVISPHFARANKGYCVPGSKTREIYKSQCDDKNTLKVAARRKADWSSFGYLIRKTAAAFVMGCLDNPNPQSNSFWQKNLRTEKDSAENGRLQDVTTCAFGKGGNRFFSQHKKICPPSKNDDGEEYIPKNCPEKTKTEYFDTTRFVGTEVTVQRPDGKSSGVSLPYVVGPDCKQDAAYIMNSFIKDILPDEPKKKPAKHSKRSQKPKK